MKHKPEETLQQNTLEIQLPYHIGVHSNLALVVSKTGDAEFQRGFGIWAILRSNERPSYSKVELLQILKKTGKSLRSQLRWLKKGEGIFWHKEHCKNNEIRYFWIGKNNVFKYFNLEKPGNVLTIRVEEILNPKLTVLRAALKDCFINRETKWTSRETIEKLTGVKRRTQQAYDKESGLHRQYCCEFKNWTDGKGKKHDVIQIPTLYHARFERYHIHDRNKYRASYDLYVPEYNATENPSELEMGGIEVNRANGRYFYNCKDGANARLDVMESKGIQGQVIYRNKISTRNNLIMSGLHTSY